MPEHPSNQLPLNEIPTIHPEAAEAARVLVVDDQPENGRLVANILARAGYRIQLAEDAESALRLIQTRPPTLILLDIMMPGIDGFEMCRRLKENPDTQHIPVIFFTGRDDSESLKTGFDLGGVDYITKPIDEGILLARVGSQIRLLRQQDRLREGALELARARRMEAVGRLAGGVAHEFNNLLQVILGYAELLEEQMEDRSMLELLSPILESGTRGKEIVRELLVYTDQNENSTGVEIDLEEAVGALELMLAQAVGQGIELRCETESAPIVGDPTGIEQIITNLCLNAREAILPKKGCVTVRTGTVRFSQTVSVREATMPAGEYAFLVVADNGRGIRPSQLRDVFEPFFSTREVGEGTGLGLSVVWGILRRHEAFIDAHSVPGEGTEFICYFPIHRVRMEQPDNPIDQEQQDTATARHVLVCEDDSLVRGFTVDLFRSFGYEVDVAADGHELISLFDENPRRYCLIYTDIAMPRMSGPVAVESLRDRHERIPPILFATGHGNSDIKTHLASSDNEIVLRKPFTRAALNEAVQAAHARAKAESSVELTGAEQ